MPAGQQIAFQPALALVLAEHLHHAAVGGRRGRRWGGCGRSSCRLVTSKTAPQRLEVVSSGLKTRKLRPLRFSFITSRMNCALDAVASALTAPGLGTSTA